MHLFILKKKNHYEPDQNQSMNSLWKKFQFLDTSHAINTVLSLKQSLRSQLNSKSFFSHDRDICRFVVLVILFRLFIWTEKRMTLSLVTVYDQRVSPDNGCACAIIRHVRSNVTWLRQLIPVDIYVLTKQMVGTPESWPFVESRMEYSVMKTEV